MKLITAIVKPDKADELIGAAIREGVCGVTATDVRGFGRQYGQLTYGQPDDTKVALLAKIRLDIVVLDDDAEAVAATIAKHARTGVIGDGKIWITTVDSAIRVRTGERDRDAL
jgi:nitrogen regulatory protein PII